MRRLPSRRQKLDFIADHITTHVRFDETAFQGEAIKQLARQFKRHLRPILLAVELASSPAHTALAKAIAFLQDAYAKGKPLGDYATTVSYTAHPLCRNK